MSNARKVLTVAGLVALAWAVAPGAEAQPPIRIGASLAQTGVSATVAQNQLRGYQLCVKHTNDKGGVLGRKLELVVYDDGSDPATAVRLYEKLITQAKVDLVLGPYGAPTTDAVADVTEKYKMLMVAPSGSATSIYRKGRKFIFSMRPPAELYLEGLIDLAAKKGLKTVALITTDNLLGRAVTQGGIELAKKKGIQVVSVDAYPRGTTDFSTILTKVRAANPDVLGGATVFEDGGARPILEDDVADSQLEREDELLRWLLGHRDDELLRFGARRRPSFLRHPEILPSSARAYPLPAPLTFARHLPY